MDKSTVESEILSLTGDILLGKANEGEIKRVTKLAIENNCMDILKREFLSASNILTRP